jgi:hypothetical protein
VDHKGFLGRRLCLVLVGAAVLVVGVNAGSAASGPAGASEGDPITQVGRSGTSQTYVDIYWSDGTTETVPADGPPSQSLATQVLAERAAAEQRSVAARASAAGGMSPSASDGDGVSACSWTLAFPWKESSDRAATAANVQCTVDVTDIWGTLYLYRSANYTLIGSDGESGSMGQVYWFADGACLSSTWQYNADLTYGFTGQNGSRYAEHWAGPSWISC